MLAFAVSDGLGLEFSYGYLWMDQSGRALCLQAGLEVYCTYVAPFFFVTLNVYVGNGFSTYNCYVATVFGVIRNILCI